jgi:hypothetical protein
MKRLVTFTLVITMLFALAISASASNQDFISRSAVSIEGSATTVSAGESAYIDITVANLADRGMPDVSIWINGSRFGRPVDIAKGGALVSQYAINTDTDGVLTFDVEVWTRINNKNFAQLLSSKTITIEVGAEDLLKKMNDAIDNGDYYGDGPITIIVDGVEYVFTSNSGNYNGYGSLFCWVDGVEYRLERNAHSLLGVYIN